MHCSVRKSVLFIVRRKYVCAYSPKNSFSTVDLRWLLYSTRSKRVNIPQGCSSQPTDVHDKRSEYQYVTGGRNVTMLLEGGIPTCYCRTECQYVTGGGNINMLLVGGMSVCYWRAECQYVARWRNVNMILEGGLSTCYCRAECQRY
jgi:hypothetical protein